MASVGGFHSGRPKLFHGPGRAVLSRRAIWARVLPRQQLWWRVITLLHCASGRSRSLSGNARRLLLLPALGWGNRGGTARLRGGRPYWPDYVGQFGWEPNQRPEPLQGYNAANSLHLT